MSQWWCKKMHSKAMWPIHGRYICPDCHREYPVSWEAPATEAEYRREPQARAAPQLEEWGRKPSWSAKMFVQRAVDGLKRSDTI
jgi:hypothetical protein